MVAEAFADRAYRPDGGLVSRREPGSVLTDPAEVARIFDAESTIDEDAEEPEEPYAIAATRGGLALRFSLRAHREPSTRSGRKFTRPKQGDEVIYVAPVFAEECVACITKQRRALVCEADDSRRIPANVEIAHRVAVKKLAAAEAFPRVIESALDAELAKFLLKACAPYRGDRFSTAAEMRNALQAIRDPG